MNLLEMKKIFNIPGLPIAEYDWYYAVVNGALNKQEFCILIKQHCESEFFFVHNRKGNYFFGVDRGTEIHKTQFDFVIHDIEPVIDTDTEDSTVEQTP